MSNILTGFNMQGNDPIDDRIVSKNNLETLEQYLNRVPVQKRYYGLTFFALDKNNELRKYTFQTSLINPTIDDNEEEIERIDKELQEHVSNKAIHKTSEEIRSEIVDADIPDTIARVQWTLDQINTAVINLIGGASDEYNTLKRIQTKIEELRAKIYGDDGSTVLNTLEQALKFLNQYKDFIVDIPENFVNKQDIVDNLTTDDPTKVLSAKQGKILSDTLTNYFESAMQSIRTETDRAINAENRIEAKLDQEIDRSIKEDQRIDSKLDAEIERSTNEDIRIDTKLDSEINRSTTEDNRLDKKIDAETTRATEAESNLNTKIETETDRAINAENRIETKLDKEIDRSIKEDQRIDAKLDAEIKRSTDEDLRIDSKLDSEINRSTTEDDRLDKKIDAETTRATTVESNLNTKIETETDRAEGEESRIEAKLDNEITRSTNKDTEHDNRLQALEGQTHEQNTDLGTTNSTFQLKYNTGNKIKHESDAISVRNAADTDYVNFIAKNATFKGDLLVEGQSFVTEAETVEIKDNLLLLNKGEVGSGVTKGIAGIEIDRGTEPNYQIIFDESDNRFKAGEIGDIQCLALRDGDNSMVNGMFTSWDSSTKRLKTTNIVPSSSLLYFGDNKKVALSYNNSEGLSIYNGNNALAIFPTANNTTFRCTGNNFQLVGKLITLNETISSTFRRTSDNSEVLYHADIVNNLTSGGTNKVLSAEQGKLLQNSITSIQGSYLPLSGGTMTGSIIFPNRKGIFGTLTNGTSNIKIAVINANNNVEIGNSNTPLMLESNSTDLTHYRDNNTYKIWDKFNLSDPATSTDLAKYLPLAGGVMTGNIRFPIGNGIACGDVAGTAAYVVLRTWNANNSTRMYVGTVNFPTYISSTASDLIHDRNGSSYLLWDSYNLSSPVTYTTNTYNHATLTNKDGQYFTYIKAGTNGLLPHSQVTLANGGSGYLGTSDNSFNAAYINNLHTNKVTFGDAGSFIDNQSGDSDHKGIGFYTSQNAACPVYVGSLCVSNSYANGAPNIPTNGIYSKGVIKSAAGFTSNSRQTNLNLAKTGNDVLYISSFTVDSTGSPGTDSNTGKNVNDGMFLTYFWVNDNAFQLAADIDGTGMAYRHYTPSSGNSTTGWKFLADTNWVVSKINSSTSNFLKKTGDTATGQIILDSNGIAFKANIWTNDLTPNKNYSGYLQVLDAYDAASAGGPTNYGTVLQINSRNSHWANQLWFPGGAEASKKGLYYRHMPYNSTTYGEWIKLATTSDLGNYLPLSGGTLSGNLTINTVGSTTFVINNNDTNGSETFMRVLRKGTASAAIGFRDSLGAYIYNYNSNKYLFIDNDGYARVGTTSGSTRLALITDIPTTWDWSNITNKKIDGSDHTSSKDCNNSLTNGIYYYNQNGPTTSIGASTTDGALFHQKYSDSWIAQIAQDYRNGNLFVRGKNNGTWTAWKKVALTSDIPSISGYATQSWCNSKFAPLTNFTLTSNYATIKGNGNEICIGNTSQSSASAYMIINYRVPTGCTYAPSAFYFKAGSAESWANIYAGNVYMSSNLVATQTWSSGQFPTKTGTGASGTWGISITGNATTATTASKLGSTTIGGSAKPIYLSSGTPTACSATVGSATVPVYMNAGTITQCSTTLGVSITGNAATSTNSTQLGGIAASSYVKANDNISRLTNDRNYVRSTSTLKVADIQVLDGGTPGSEAGILYIVLE